MSYIELSKFLRSKDASIRLTKQDFLELEKNISEKYTCQKKVFGIYCVRSRFYPDNYVNIRCISNYFTTKKPSELFLSSSFDKFDVCFATQSKFFGTTPIFTENHCFKCHQIAIDKYLKGELTLYNDVLYKF